MDTDCSVIENESSESSDEEEKASVPDAMDAMLSIRTTRASQLRARTRSRSPSPEDTLRASVDTIVRDAYTTLHEEYRSDAWVTRRLKAYNGLQKRRDDEHYDLYVQNVRSWLNRIQFDPVQTFTVAAALESIPFVDSTLENLALATLRFPDAACLHQQYLRNVVLQGPPGTGKTTRVQRCATRIRLPVLSVTKDMFTSSFQGDQERNALAMQSAIALMQPMFVVFDDFDTVLLARQAARDDTTTANLKTVIMDQLDGRPAIPGQLIVCATNRYADLDEANHSRFGQVLYFDLPDENARIAAWSHHLHKYGFVLDDASLQTLGTRSARLDYRRIQTIAAKAGLKKLLSSNHADEITLKSPTCFVWSVLNEQAQLLSPRPQV
jgi:hypothetical protein